MKTIKIKFVDFWDHWNVNDNFIINILKKHYNVVISEEPDYIFFSNFNNYFNHMDYNNCVKIFYTQENIVPDFNYCDYGIGFDFIQYEDRYIRYPIHYIEERYGEAWRLMKHKHLINNETDYTNREFCSFVVSNGAADKCREEMFYKLSQYKVVNSGGKYLNNIGVPNGVNDKYMFQKGHKFSLCFENTSHPGYSTEKIVESFAAQTIPIYWGDKKINEVFNKKSFINVNDFECIDDAIKRIIEIDKNKNLYLSMLKEPALNIDKENIWDEKQKEFESFLISIFDQPIESAKRRNMQFWGDVYHQRYYKMRKSYVICYENALARLVRKIKNRVKF